MEAEFSAFHSKPVNLKDLSNLIALSIQVSENYSLKPTLEKYTMLYDIKEVTGFKRNTGTTNKRIKYSSY